MSIRFISGKPGGGKSLYAVRDVIRELVHGQRLVITNLPLILGNLQEYLIEQGHSVNVFQRVRLLDPSETQEFWRYRTLSGPAAQLNERNGRPDINEPITFTSDALSPVAYYIDEAHIPFNAHRWTEVGLAGIWYASQHRHFGDDVWLITQFIDNVAKQFRSLAQDFVFVRNRRKERFGAFKMGNGFETYVYLQKPTGHNDVAVDSEKFELDVKGIAACYDTTAGIGVAKGAHGDQGEKKRGLPIWSLWVGLLVVVGLAFWGASSVPAFLGMTRKGVEKPVTDAPIGELSRLSSEKQADKSPVNNELNSASPGERSGERVQPLFLRGLEQIEPTSEFFATGYIVLGRRFIVQLSNGQVLTENTGNGRNDPRSVRRIDSAFVELVSGERIPIKARNQAAAPILSESVDISNTKR